MTERLGLIWTGQAAAALSISFSRKFKISFFLFLIPFFSFELFSLPLWKELAGEKFISLAKALRKNCFFSFFFSVLPLSIAIFPLRLNGCEVALHREQQHGRKEIRSRIVHVPRHVKG